ncbi:hypothetical protein CVS40_12941 [Lucilia cuprina]|nr:hypothetical protein CVS40_12941 [Lucilia cuprina]
MLAQKEFYQREYDLLSENHPIPKDSSLFTLNPFQDSKGLLRVSGRLANSLLPYNERFPIILPRNSHFCNLYLSYLHGILSHGEP